MSENKEIQLTEKSTLVLQFLQGNDNGEEGYFGVEIAKATGCNEKGIHGVMNSLVKKGLVTKGSRDAEFVAKDGTKGVKPYTTYFLTDAGRAFEA